MPQIAYPQPAIPPGYLESIRASIVRGEMFSAAVREFLSCAYPLVPLNVVDNLATALKLMMTAGPADALAHYSSLLPSTVPEVTERLIYLVGERDQLSGQIASFDKGIANLADLNNPEAKAYAESVGNMVEAMSIAPLRQRLAAIEAEISQLQQTLESDGDGAAK